MYRITFFATYITTTYKFPIISAHPVLSLVIVPHWISNIFYIGTPPYFLITTCPRCSSRQKTTLFIFHNPLPFSLYIFISYLLYNTYLRILITLLYTECSLYIYFSLPALLIPVVFLITTHPSFLYKVLTIHVFPLILLSSLQLQTIPICTTHTFP